MERDNEVALFNRSVEKLGLIYKQYIGHWDSNSYSTVCASYPDGPTEFIETEECISHVTKRMGTQLHEIVHRQKAEHPKHDDCPEGAKSWCSYQRDIALSTNNHKCIQNPLAPAVVKCIQPVFDRLGKQEFLAACANSRTHKLNESYHHVVWSLAQKESLLSLSETKLAVQVATMLFTEGVHKCFTNIFHSMDMNITENMKNQRISIDDQKSKRKTLKRRNIKMMSAFTHNEGVQYK